MTMSTGVLRQEQEIRTPTQLFSRTSSIRIFTGISCRDADIGTSIIKH